MRAMKSIYKGFTIRTLLSILIVHISMLSFATTYYVSNTGNNTNSGLTEALPWKTLAKINSTAFKPGDRILLKSGDIFRESLIPSVSGINGNEIVISHYGIGEKPEIRGYGPESTLINPANWSEYASGIWRIACDVQYTRMWLNGDAKFECANLSLSTNFPWKWQNGYIYIKAPSNPANYYSSIQNRSPLYANIDLTSKSNIIFRGIKNTGGYYSFRLLNCKNITIDSCEVGYKVQAFGFFISSTSGDSCSNIIINNNIIETGDSLYYTYYRGYHSTADAIWLGQGSVNCKIYNNYFNGWSHGALEMINLNAISPYHDNEFYNNFITAPLIDYSRGFVAYFTANGYGNSIHDNTIVNTTIQNQCEGHGLKVYNNIIDNVSQTPYSDKQVEANGLSIEGTSTQPSNMEIYNNTITNCDYTGIRILGGSIDKSFMNIHDNNIYNNGNLGTFHNGFQMVIISGTGVQNETYANNHLYNSITNNVVSYGGIVYNINGFNSVTTINNDVITGNNSSLKYFISGLGSYMANVNDLRIEYNETAKAKTIAVAQIMIDTNGTKYSTSVTLQPFSSMILFKDPTVYFTEYKIICEGTTYNGWIVNGQYERTMKAVSGADSIVTTYLTVNPKYAITEDVSITEGEVYQGWTKSGMYSRNLTSISGCDSIVTTNFTVEKLVVKQGEIAPVHYSAVWKGENGQNHMNIMVVSATLEDLPLSVDDEIAVFSGSACVGAKMLTQTINAIDNSTFLTIPASQNDGANNGFTDNDTIIFKIWDNKNQKEMVAKAITYRNDVSHWLTSGRFVPGATSVVEIVSYLENTQSIDLKKGYNMISTFVTAQNPNVSSVTQSLYDEGSLIKMQDEAGNSFENWGSFGGWINNVGSIKKTEGYKIKVANNCTLNVTGRPVALPLDIPLKTGWNIISFPHSDMIDAMNVIQSLIDLNKLVKVQDEIGNSIENWGIFGGWKNGIGYFIPGKAYKVKMNADAVLTIEQNYTKSAVILASAEPTVYFSTGIEGNGTDHININLVGLHESGISIGDELAALDNGRCVGALKITENHLMAGSASLIASFSTDDQNQNGFKVDDTIQLSVWNKLTNQVSQVQVEVIDGQLKYELNSSVLAKIKSSSTSMTSFETIVKIDVFPNPSKGKVTVRFSQLPVAGSIIDILNISGRKITSRLITGLSEEFNLDQQPAGLYIVKSIIGSDETIQKLIINK